jgi:4-aminobutyrate aminotransferase-like enzyme
VSDEAVVQAARARETEERLSLAATYVPGPVPWLAVSEASGAWIHAISGMRYLDFGEGARVSLLGHSAASPAHTIQDHLNHYLYPGPVSTMGSLYPVLYAKALSRRFPLDDDKPYQVLVCSGVPEARQVIRQLTCDVGVVEIRPVSPTGRIDGAIVVNLVHQARANGKLVMVNEELSGFGRTGSFLGIHYYDIVPDIFLLGPAGAGGLPFAAVVAPVRVFERCSSLGPYFTSPLACAAALGVLSGITPALMHHVTEMGELLERLIMEVSQQFPSHIREVTGMGLLRQVMLTKPERQQEFLVDCRGRGLILGTELTLTPPLTVLPDEIEAAADLIADVLMEWGK